MDTTQIIRNSLLKAVSYETYRNLIDKYATEGKSSGEEQTEERIYYTALNQKRYKRLDKTIEIPEDKALFFANYPKSVCLLVITESWCASVATKMVEGEKAKNGKLTPEFKEELQKWYNQDKGATIVDDFMKIMKTL